MNDLFFARSQMGMSLAFHIIFAVIGMAMPLLMAISEGCSSDPGFAHSLCADGRRRLWRWHVGFTGSWPTSTASAARYC
jgi:hypothetical protein